MRIPQTILCQKICNFGSNEIFFLLMKTLDLDEFTDEYY